MTKDRTNYEEYEFVVSSLEIVNVDDVLVTALAEGKGELKYIVLKGTNPNIGDVVGIPVNSLVRAAASPEEAAPKAKSGVIENMVIHGTSGPGGGPIDQAQLAAELAFMQNRKMRA